MSEENLDLTFGASSQEPDDQLFICFLDVTYGTAEDEEQEAQAYKQQLIEQYDLEGLVEVDIFPGASLPAWLVTIGLGIQIIVTGADLIEAPATYIEFAAKVKRYVTNGTKIVVSKNGAMMLALDAVNSHLTYNPISLSVIAYDYVDNRLDQVDYTMKINGVQDAPYMEWLSAVDHIFDVRADDRAFRVVIKDGKVVYLEEVDHNAM
ncbi:hypothetical protein PsAD46_05415 [Pseudovibrio sp. Ad46]|uniref:hypothetical protein n=1 Tax=Pseudovibrio sp. Ad46 TaxID=989432 RepID=UPI0007AEDA8E|nr:hypothetical protein [Pseudovibrio sp. Ad46]KZK76158.1 hypothetical protein PsAD46_05415 [Pseudovibrio sp. Ad46]